MLESRIRPRCQSLMKGLFLDGHVYANGNGILPAYVRDVQQRHGITDLRVLKIRRDTKVIARGRHPQWGDVAIKALDPITNSVGAASMSQTDAMVASDPAPFLPAVLAHDTGYSVTQWVNGVLVTELRTVTGPGAEPFVEFFDTMGAWCVRGMDAAPLTAPEVVSIVRFHIDTTVRRMQYRGSSLCVASCVKFLRDEKRLRGYLDEVHELAPLLELPRTRMLSDLNTGNLIHEHESGRIMLIDHEALRRGHYLFDVVFFVASVIAARLPANLTDELAGRVLSREYMPSETADRFFRSLACYVAEAFMTIDGRPRREIDAAVAMLLPPPRR
jgi:hypothetical protein